LRNIVCLILFILLLLLSSCLQFKRESVLHHPSFILERSILCSEIEFKDDWAQPLQEKKTFLKGEDQRVYSFLGFKDVQGEHVLVWKWYDPSQKIYRTTDKIKIGKEGQYFDKYIAWDNLLLFEEKENGKWRVVIFLDDCLLDAREFEIQEDQSNPLSSSRDFQSLSGLDEISPAQAVQTGNGLDRSSVAPRYS